MMEKNTKKLGCWLVSKGENSLLKIQKLLFFIRVEELKENKFRKINDSFFNENHNFQAWVYGPVNVESFKYLQDWFNRTNEIEQYLLPENEMEFIDSIYNKYYLMYKDMSINELIDRSHKNKAWKNSRKGYSTTEICRNYLEEDKTFIEFEIEN